MRIDALEVADDVQMQARGRQRFGLARRQALDMRFGGAALEFAEADLLAQQLARHAHVARHEDVQRQRQIVRQPLVHARDLGEALVGEAQIVLDLLGRQLHQVLVDDVADMLEIGGEGQHVDGAPRIGIVELLAADPDDVELDRLVQLVDRVVHALDVFAEACGRRCGTRPASCAAWRRSRRPGAWSRAPPRRWRPRACRARWDRDSAACPRRRARACRA